MFGRRKVPFGAAAPAPAPSFPQAPVDSDGKRRVFGEAIFAGPHGDMLRQLGFSPDDSSNILPEPEDFDRLVQESLRQQEIRRQAHEADLLARFGCNAVRPFFLFGEGVYNTMHGQWLIRVMRLLPYDDWNLVYLPMDRPTAAATGLPFHPQQSIEAIDGLMLKRVTEWHERFTEARRKVDAAVAQGPDIELIGRFNDYADGMRQSIRDYAAETFPMVIELIADVQRKAGMQ